MHYNHLKTKYSSKQYSLIIAIALHLMIAFLIMFKFKSSTTSPVLSFSITMNDLASNPNSISVASISTSKKPIKDIDQKIVDDKSGKDVKKIPNKKLEQQLKKLSDKTDDLQNSKQQSAVFAKDTPAIFDAAYLENPTPIYPKLSRRLKEQGLVILNVLVSEDGTATQISIKKSSGFPRLDNAALETVKNWRFIAAKKDQKLVASQVQVPINFILE